MGILPDWMIERDVKITPFEPQEDRPGIVSYGCTSFGYDARIAYDFKIFSNVLCGDVDPKAFDPRSFAEISVKPVPHAWTRNPKQTNREPQNRICSQCNKTEDNETVDDEVNQICFRPSKFIKIPPNSFALGSTVEHFEIPRDCLALCVGKSTYARCGIIINVTPLEPEWKGHVTVEISNTTPLPAKIYAGEGIMQVIFLRTDGVGEALLNAVRRLSDPTRNDTPVAHRQIEEMLHADLGQSTCRRSYADKKGKYQDQKDGVTLPRVD